MLVAVATSISDHGLRKSIEHSALLSRIVSQCFAAAARVPRDDSDTPCVGMADVVRAGGKSRRRPRPEPRFILNICTKAMRPEPC